MSRRRACRKAPWRSRLADAGFAFEKQRAPHLEGEKQHGRKRTIGEIIGRRSSASASSIEAGGRFGGGLFMRGNLSGRFPGLSRQSTPCLSDASKT